MYPNLERELSRKNVSKKTVQELLGISEKTLYNKMAGVTDFTLPEVLSICDNILPEFELRYLFSPSREQRGA